MNWRTVFRAPLLRRAGLVASHLVLTAVGYYAAFEMRFDFRIPAAALERFAATLPILILARLALAIRFRLDRGYWAHVGVPDLLRLASAATLGSVVFAGTLLALGRLDGIPASVLGLEWLLAIALTGGVRLAARCWRESRRSMPLTRGKRTLILGAGDAGEQILRQLQHDPRCGFQVVGLIDDDPAKLGRELHGVPVLGTSEDLRRLAIVHEIHQALIAIPSITGEKLRRLVDLSVQAAVEVRLLPPLRDLVAGEVHLNQVREVRIDCDVPATPLWIEADAGQVRQVILNLLLNALEAVPRTPLYNRLQQEGRLLHGHRAAAI